MKTIRKLIGMIMSVMMLWTTTLTLAAEQYTIRVINARADETYRIYRMMDVTVNAEKDSYSYTIAEGWDAFFSSTGAGYPYVTIKNGYITAVNPATIEEFGKAAQAYVTTSSVSEAASSVIAPSSGIVDFTLSAPGYYLITSTAGSLVSLETTPQNKTVTVTEKTLNSAITCVQLGDDLDPTTAMIGAPVQYQDILMIQKGAVNEVLHLHLSDGMTLSQIDSVTVNGNPLVNGTDYTVENNPTSDSCDLHISFTKQWLDQLSAATEVNVIFSVYLNGNAAVKGNTESLQTWLSDGTVSTTKTVTKTLSTLFFDLIKVESKSGKILEGAKFELYTQATGGEKIALVKESDGVYHVASVEEKSTVGFVSAVIEAGRARIEGFDGWSTVYLEEIKAPDGFNRMASRVEISFRENNKETAMSGDVWTEDDGGIGILNSKGTILPATGGNGNTFFYMFGGALCMIAGALMLRISLMENE